MMKILSFLNIEKELISIVKNFTFLLIRFCNNIIIKKYKDKIKFLNGNKLIRIKILKEFIHIN